MIGFERCVSYDYIAPHDIHYEPTKIERNLLHLAYCISLESDVKCAKHASFILDKDDNVVSVFVNSRNGITGSDHAEYGAIEKLKNKNVKLEECKLMVVRGNLVGNKCISRPCLDCYNTILNSGIKEVIYSVDEHNYKKMYMTPKIQN